MQDQSLPSWIVILAVPAFFLFFAAMWVGMTALLSAMAGWPTLVQHFPDRDEAPIRKFGFQSASMGSLRVSMGGILTLSACPSGMRVAIWRLFGPFSRPFLVPWNEIVAIDAPLLFMARARLGFGSPEVGNLIISVWTWDQLSRADPRRAMETPPSPHKERNALLTEIGVQCVLPTVFAVAFFCVVFTLAGHTNLIEITTCIGFPIVAIGLPSLTQVLVQSRRRGG